MLSSSVAYLRCKKLCDAQSEEKIGCASDVLIISLKVAVQACNHEIIRYIKAYLIQTRNTDGKKLYIK